MKTKFIFLGIALLFLAACSKDSSEYPRTFRFHHSSVAAEKGFVIGDNESYTEISPRAGNLDTLRSLLGLNLFNFF